MKRRLVKQGAATLMISLPSKWIQANHLGKCDEIDLIEKNNLLEISTSTKENKEITLTINKENSHDIKNLLTHIYRKGYNKIILKGDFKPLIWKIRSITNNLLLGFEITEHSLKELVLENISEPTEQKYEILQKKLFQTINETHSITLQSAEKNDFDAFQEIEDLRRNNDRFILFCRRILMKGLTGKNIPTQWELLTFLTHIQHSYYYLYHYLSKNKILSSKKLYSSLKELTNYLELFEKAYSEKKLENIHQINKLKEKYPLGECLKAIEKSHGHEAVALSYIREIFRLIQIGTSPLIIEILDQ
jgi:phosphate uptake regulator